MTSLNSASRRVPTSGPASGQAAPAQRPHARAPFVAANNPAEEIQELHRYIRQKLAEIEQVYRHAPVGLVQMDKDYRFVRINERMAEINGLPVEAHIGRTLREVLPALADHIIELYRPVYERGEPVLNIEISGETPKEPGVQRYWLANFFPFHADGGEVDGLIGAVVDITEQKRKEAELRESEERFRTIFETVSDAIFVLDVSTMKFVDANQRAVDAFGYSREELLTKSIGELSCNEAPYTQTDAETVNASALNGAARTFEWRCRRKDGSLFWVEVAVKRAAFGHGDHLLSTLRDITRRKEVEEKLSRLAQFDALTGLVNRRVFVADLERAIVESRRRDVGIAVLYLDLDHFKDVNDTLGHPVGDRLLDAVAQRLIGGVRASDIVARFGGDEFAVLMFDLAEPADAGILAEKIIAAIERPFPIEANDVHVGISIGIALAESGAKAETLLARADMALYRAKADGRQTYRFFNDTMDAEVRDRVTLVAELREAVADEQFFLLYQPQVDIASRRVIALEELVRWRHPKRGILSPAAFMTAAERSGLIVPLGKWVLTQSCRQARRWLDQNIAPPCISVNVSPLQFKAPRELEKMIEAALEDSGLPPAMLELEVTETALMATGRDLGGVFKRLRQRGVRVAIDDFGTGYSSLSYLRRYPVDRVKLAQEFIADLAPDGSDAAIAKAIIGLARLLGMDTVAEGVETAGQLKLLKSWGCTAAQGFYYARPLSVDDATALLRRGTIDCKDQDASTEVPRIGSCEAPHAA